MAETYSQLISTQDSCKYIYFKNWLQNVPTHYRLNSLVTVTSTTGYSAPTDYTALYSSFNNWLQCTGRVPATQPCTLASTTGFSVLTGTDYTALNICLNDWLQSVPAGTGYTALYTCFNYWLQSVPAGTCYTALYTCFNNWLQSVPAGTGYTALYTCFNLRVTKSTNRVLATQSLLYSASTQLVTYI